MAKKDHEKASQADVRRSDRVPTSKMPGDERERLMYRDNLPMGGHGKDYDPAGQNDVRMGTGQLRDDVERTVRGEQPANLGPGHSYDPASEGGARIQRGLEKFEKYEHQYRDGGLVRHRETSGKYAEGGTRVHTKPDSGPRGLSEAAQSRFREHGRGK